MPDFSEWEVGEVLLVFDVAVHGHEDVALAAGALQERRSSCPPIHAPVR